MEATGQLKIVETKAGDRSETVILHLSGDVDSNTAPELKARLLSLMGQVRGIILDFGGVEYVSSAGWGVVLARIKEQRSRGGDIVFARIGDTELKLDLLVPTIGENPPVVVFIHGGGWKNGSYKGNKMTWLVEHGFAVASIGYRLSDVATFPAQIHDCKGAIRWLRKKIEENPQKPRRILTVRGVGYKLEPQEC